MKFGEYIKEKRLEKGISLREFASRVGISPSYLSDIEKGRRNAPNDEKLKKIEKELFVIQKDIDQFYDLAGISKNYVATDLSEYIMENKEVRYFLRNTKDDDKDEFLEDINYIFDNREVRELVRVFREKKYTKAELELLLKLLSK
ncbi:MAG: helix-turn-helix domain-containing protein [Clostridium sp.]